jgi:metal-responsive CopG/Arc/MetJ family transcriptional regulator
MSKQARFSVSLPAELESEFSKLAEKEGLSKSELARKLIEIGLSNFSNKSSVTTVSNDTTVTNEDIETMIEDKISSALETFKKEFLAEIQETVTPVTMSVTSVTEWFSENEKEIVRNELVKFSGKALVSKDAIELVKNLFPNKELSQKKIGTLLTEIIGTSSKSFRVNGKVVRGWRLN